LCPRTWIVVGEQNCAALTVGMQRLNAIHCRAVERDVWKERRCVLRRLRYENRIQRLRIVTELILGGVEPEILARRVRVGEIEPVTVEAYRRIDIPLLVR